MRVTLFSTLITAGLLSSFLSVNVAAQTIRSEKATITVTKVADGLQHPWGIAFLPDNRMLVTERAGFIRYISQDGKKSEPLKGVPDILVAGQGGLFDVILDPSFAENQLIYFSYNEPAEQGSSTTVARAKLGEDSITELQVIFSQRPKFSSRHHFGGRLVFTPEGNLFITLGDRGQRRDDAQTLDNHHGKVIRIKPDGSIPSDNPYVSNSNALDDIWSYGHRNIQGAALHPQTGELWTHEHGPQGGDEINITQPTKNYGWPLITYGEEYGGGKIGETAKEGLEQPLHYWVPSIAPSGMAFYTASVFPAWQNNLLVGSLKFGQLVRLELTGDKVSHEERIMIGQRIRDVRQGPDGAVYLLTDQPNGQILRLTAAN
ncbi:PQQ-dependent sugar dehydrogenase [Chromatiaceae bacterium AAb-1]|nr:PQQ-dependent sugar dehydrogenase [Chromatiaceae bacterium AAb-1]